MILSVLPWFIALFVSNLAIPPCYNSVRLHRFRGILW
jgi:hypothetical protein